MNLISKLLQVRERWKMTRKAYPGWIVAPRERREILWRNTEYWVDPVVQQLNAVAPPNDLLLLSELVWRLDRIMIPLLTPWLPQFEAALNRYNLSSQTFEQADSISHEDAVFDWAEIQEAWIAIAFAILRTAREDFEVERFEKHLEQLDRIIGNNEEWRARWHYESCLWSLWQCNVPALRDQLSAWRPPQDQPVWLARKAALYAELGELSEAITLANESLQLLRETSRMGSQTFANLSQEGWTLCLHRILAETLKLSPELRSEDYSDRWNRLNEVRCNPWPELDGLRLSLEQQNAPAKKVRSVYRGFDPGSIRETSHMGWSYYTDLIPAFSLLRLFEEAGLPMRVEQGTFIPTAVANAASWLWDAMPFGSVSALLRTRDSKILGSVFQRWKLAGLDETQAKRLGNWLMAIVTHLADDPPEANPGREDFSSALFNPATELFSRLTVRMNVEMLRSAFRLAMRIYKSGPFRAAMWRRESVELLFKRLMEAAEPPLLGEWLPELLRLPLISIDLEVTHPDFWFDPLSALPSDRCREAYIESNANSVSEATEVLLSQVAQSSGVARRHALQRLSLLHLAGALSTQQSRRFGAILWSRRNPETGLPAEAVERVSLVLHLPAPPGVDRKQEVATALFSLAKKHTQNEETATGHMHPGFNYFRQLYESSHQPLSGLEAGSLIDWSEKQAIEHLGLACEWWNLGKAKISSKTDTVFAAQEARSMFSHFSDVVGQIVLPRLSPSAKQAKALAQNTLAELAGHGFNVLHSLPSQVHAGVITLEEAIPQLNRGVHSSIDDTVRDALRGVSLWGTATVVSKKLNVMPPTLVNAVVGKAEYRREPALPFTFDVLRRWVEGNYGWVGEEEMARLLTGLELLLEETAVNVAPSLRLEDSLNHLPVREEDIPTEVQPKIGPFWF